MFPVPATVDETVPRVTVTTDVVDALAELLFVTACQPVNPVAIRPTPSAPCTMARLRFLFIDISLSPAFRPTSAIVRYRI
jgi:hypothetical protein